MTSGSNFFRKPFWARQDANDAASNGTFTKTPQTSTRTAALSISEPVRRSAPVASKLLTTKEAATYLRLSPRSLERYRVEGGGPRYFKAGAGKRAPVRYRIEDLEAWLSGVSYGSTSEYGKG